MFRFYESNRGKLILGGDRNIVFKKGDDPQVVYFEKSFDDGDAIRLVLDGLTDMNVPHNELFLGISSCKSIGLNKNDRELKVKQQCTDQRTICEHGSYYSVKNLKLHEEITFKRDLNTFTIVRGEDTTPLPSTVCPLGPNFLPFLILGSNVAIVNIVDRRNAEISEDVEKLEEHLKRKLVLDDVNDSTEKVEHDNEEEQKKPKLSYPDAVANESCQPTKDEPKRRIPRLSSDMVPTVYWQEYPTRILEKPMTRFPLRTKCLVKDCTSWTLSESKDYTSWVCSECGDNIEVTKDRNMYCNCGRLDIEKILMSCGAHEFDKPDVAELKEAIDSMEPLKELNILILGESGVGKSTFINSFVNLMTFEKMMDATKNPLTIIPNAFTITDEDYSITEVKNGDTEGNTDEVTETGMSSTQVTKAYRFVLNKTIVRLIDTPGIADGRGIEQDKKNQEDILNTIASLDELHAILILMKPNTSRLTEIFKYCLDELLSHLHVSAIGSIVFAFTQTRNTNYKPGDTFNALRSLLERKKVPIKLSLDNVYCFDSESYRYITCVSQGIAMDIADEKNFNKSWTVSSDATKRMLSYISSLKPYNTKDSVSLNQARTNILHLQIPMSEVTRIITKNMEEMHEHRSELDQAETNIKDLAKKETKKETQLHTVVFDPPVTICTHPECETFDLIHEIQANRKMPAICFQPCLCMDGLWNRFKHKMLTCSLVTGKKEGTCPECGHLYSRHKHVDIWHSEQTKSVPNKEVQRMIAACTSDAEIKAVMIKSLDTEIKALQAEKEQLEMAAAMFGAFLKKNAITPFSDARIEYLKAKIEEEDFAVKKFGVPSTNLKMYQADMENYQKQLEMLMNSVHGGQQENVLDVEQLNLVMNSLFELRRFGENLKKIMETSIKHSQRTYREVNVNIHGSINDSFKFL